MTGIRAEVWGSPIGHSRSPDLHLACYTHLGHPGTYSRRDVTEKTLADTFAEQSGTLTGISLTMPLKTGILELVRDHRGDVEMLHAANTAVNTDGHWWLANTDPLGAAAMLRTLLPSPDTHVVLLGAGATAKSLVLGLTHLSFTGHLSIVVRSANRATDTLHLAQRCGMSVDVAEFGALGDLAGASVVVSTLPSGTSLANADIEALCATGATLMDVGYHPWPTPLAEAFSSRGLVAHSGLPMLMFQALGQIRAFVCGDTAKPLPDEAGALLAMATAIDLDPVWATPSLMGE
jgi:shikimate dehydrogenase